MTNPFDIFLTSAVTIQKPDGSRSALLKATVEHDRIEIHDLTVAVDAGDYAIRDLSNGKHEYYEVQRVEYKDGIARHIPQWILLHCVRRKEPMPSFGSHTLVTIIRARGTPDEKTWEAQMGGDRARNALFYLDDRVKTGDEIHCELFDEPKIITKVDPSMTLSGPSHWEAEMMPQSEWQRRYRPPSPNITVTGQGARVNVGSLDQSVQHFHGAAADNAAILHLLEEIRTAIQQNLGSSPESKDAALDVEQLKAEVQRSKPDKSLVWSLVERLNGLAGLAEKVAKLMPLLQHLSL
jgi:hypothetical protein